MHYALSMYVVTSYELPVNELNWFGLRLPLQVRTAGKSGGVLGGRGLHLVVCGLLLCHSPALIMLPSQRIYTAIQYISPIAAERHLEPRAAAAPMRGQPEHVAEMPGQAAAHQQHAAPAQRAGAGPDSRCTLAGHG